MNPFWQEVIDTGREAARKFVGRGCTDKASGRTGIRRAAIVVAADDIKADALAAFKATVEREAARKFVGRGCTDKASGRTGKITALRFGSEPPEARVEWDELPAKVDWRAESRMPSWVPFDSLDTQPDE